MGLEAEMGHITMPQFPVNIRGAISEYVCATSQPSAATVCHVPVKEFQILLHAIPNTVYSFSVRKQGPNCWNTIL